MKTIAWGVGVVLVAAAVWFCVQLRAFLRSLESEPKRGEDA